MRYLKLTLLSISMFLLFSCDREACCADGRLILSGRFEHEIPNCDNSENAEVNCVEWLEFISDSKVDLLYGGSDVARRFSYTQETELLILQGPATSSFMPTFIIKDQSTLERRDNGDIWKKK